MAVYWSLQNTTHKIGEKRHKHSRGHGTPITTGHLPRTASGFDRATPPSKTPANFAFQTKPRPYRLMRPTAVLLIDCPDRKGLVASVAGLLYQYGANIIHSDQHQDHEAGLFFIRVEWPLEDFDLAAFRTEFQNMAANLQMRWSLVSMSEVPRVAIFVSQYLHCLVDILHRQQMGELRCSIPLIISNHAIGEDLARFYGVEFRHVPVRPGLRIEAEELQLECLRIAGIELIVLARYMQILSPEFVRQYPSQIINVHHSFLPAFAGARPYHAAFDRGVKLIGATSHYVTEALDDGPIIEQDVARISHRDQVEDLVQKGRDLERVVLSRAVMWHVNRRILCYGNKTVIFD
jgi:formyltetrahydrofolate deformylase